MRDARSGAGPVGRGQHREMDTVASDRLADSEATGGTSEPAAYTRVGTAKGQVHHAVVEDVDSTVDECMDRRRVTWGVGGYIGRETGSRC